MFHKVFILLVIFHIQQAIQFLLDGSISFDLVVYLLHLVVYAAHVISLHSVRLFPTVGGEGFSEMLRVYLVLSWSLHDL
jgi:hypothetical protein